MAGNPQKHNICAFGVRQVFRENDTFYLLFSGPLRTGSIIKKMLQFTVNACERCNETNIVSINFMVNISIKIAALFTSLTTSLHLTKSQATYTLDR